MFNEIINSIKDYDLTRVIEDALNKKLYYCI